MFISFPDTRDTINAIRNAIGRPIYFYQPERIPCSACSIDPVTDTSTNSFCIVCSGEGYITTYEIATITGHITHGQLDNMQWVPGGQYYDGDTRIQIEFTAGNMTIISNTEYVIIDGKTFDFDRKKIILRGVPEINRVLLDLKERDT